LRDQQKDPAGKQCAVHVNDGTGERCAEQTGKIVAGRKTHKNRDQHEPSHARKKEVVETPAWQACRHRWARAGMCCGSGHHASKWFKFEGKFPETL
jgi:hypothetical protein